MRRHICALALLPALAAGAVIGPLHAQPAAAIPREVAALAGQHPAEYYRRATDLFGTGRKDDAVFVFYLGQLRYRTHLKARPDLKPDGDPALFASLSEVVGRPLNEYAFGDIPALAHTMEAVLAYDAANPDPFTPPGRFRDAHASVRDGLAGLRRQVLADQDSIRAQRTKNGLENRN
jgi:hypothetical protein